nr:ECF-type sigma factor [Rhodopirellula sp. SM50]
MPLVYDELRKLAAAKMAGERLDHTLPPTALVHEAYLRLIGSDKNDGSVRGARWEGRGHFFAAAAEAMRRILVDHARNSRRLKRGGEFRKFSLEGIELAWNPKYGHILELSESLDGLAEVAPEAAELVKLRCFAGQTFPEAAALLGISIRRPSDVGHLPGLGSTKRCWTKNHKRKVERLLLEGGAPGSGLEFGVRGV